MTKRAFTKFTVESAAFAWLEASGWQVVYNLNRSHCGIIFGNTQANFPLSRTMHGMKYDRQNHHRRSIRLKGYDYSQPGACFVTICTQNRACLFGDAVDGKMQLNDTGEIVRQCWLDIPAHFPNAVLDEFAVMPNHVHGILWIVGDYGDGVGARHAVPLRDAIPVRTEQFGKPVAGSIPTIIRSFKSAVTKRITERRGTPGASVWQRNYYEHIIRNEESLNHIRQYIANNPLQWRSDQENPNRNARHTVPLPKDEPWRT